LRKRRLLSIALVGVLLISGCNGTQQAESDPENQFYEGELSVYYFSNPHSAQEVTFFDGALERFQDENPEVELELTAFSDPEVMDQRLLTELSSGAGPDVILMQSGENSIDFLKAAVNGYFYDITDHVAKEKTRHAYYENAFDSGILLGRQYILPMSAKVMQIYTSKEKAAVYFTNLPEQYTTEELLTSLSRAAQTVKDKEDVMALIYSDWSTEDNKTFFMDWVRATGIDFVDMTNKTVIAPKEKLRVLAEFTKNMIPDTQKEERLIDLKSLRTFEDYVRHGVSYAFYQNFVRMFGNLNLTTSQLGETNLFLKIPTFEDKTKCSLSVSHFGVINANTQNPDAAWGLLQRCINYTPLNLSRKNINFDLYISLNRDLNEAVFTYMNWMKNSDGSPFINYESKTEMIDVFNTALSWKISNKAVDNIVEQAMGPYFNGAKSFDDCFYDLESKLSIYINE
jgi:ABC-type glycerol-3-phosphate transport system substrate-binding protein